MMSILGFILKSWLMVLCSVLYITSANEQGMNGTMAQNLSCVVYTVDISSMNCTWDAGWNTPKDTQYFLYLKYIEEKEEIECPHYINSPLGRHVACHFPNVTVNANEVDIRLSGSSKESPIQNLTAEYMLYEKEKLAPPQNIIVSCYENTSSCVVRWKRPPSARRVPHDYCFMYEVKDELRNTSEMISGYTQKNYSNDAKYILRFRTRGNFCSITQDFGDWSDPIEFGTDSSTIPTIHVVLVILGTFVVIFLLVLIYKRTHLWKLLTLPVPQPKNIIQQYEFNMEKVWMGLVPSADENVTPIEEISCKNTHCSQATTLHS